MYFVVFTDGCENRQGTDGKTEELRKTCMPRVRRKLEEKVQSESMCNR